MGNCGYILIRKVYPFIYFSGGKVTWITPIGTNRENCCSNLAETDEAGVNKLSKYEERGRINFLSL